MSDKLALMFLLAMYVHVSLIKFVVCLSSVVVYSVVGKWEAVTMPEFFLLKSNKTVSTLDKPITRHPVSPNQHALRASLKLILNSASKSTLTQDNALN